MYDKASHMSVTELHTYHKTLPIFSENEVYDLYPRRASLPQGGICLFISAKLAIVLLYGPSVSFIIRRCFKKLLSIRFENTIAVLAKISKNNGVNLTSPQHALGISVSLIIGVILKCHQFSIGSYSPIAINENSL